jgi:hypothetical protein
MHGGNCELIISFGGMNSRGGGGETPIGRSRYGWVQNVTVDRIIMWNVRVVNVDWLSMEPNGDIL